MKLSNASFTIRLQDHPVQVPMPDFGNRNALFVHIKLATPKWLAAASSVDVDFHFPTCPSYSSPPALRLEGTDISLINSNSLDVPSLLKSFV